ncbi:MAG: hypothetical protein J7498_08490 [Sphingobium sp.]|nr:hypothetical protein [Sphingobium sp.]
MIGQPALSRNATIVLLLAIWAAVCTALLIVDWHFVGPMNFRDPDDALRLVQVRDLLGGQSWFDLTQHRIHPPTGVPMHWSRLVDLPIALTLAALKPLLGTALAERATLIIVPLTLLLILMVVAYKMARWVGLGRCTALLAVAMLGTSLGILIQFAPMRIDHHGPQILCGAIAMLAILNTWRRDGRSGMIAGIAMACWLQISVEGLPCAVAMGGVLAVRHVLRVDCWPDFRNYLIALTVASAALLFGTHFPSDALIPWCDSFSPAFQVPLAVTCLTVLAASKQVRSNDMVRRALPLVFGGAAGAAVFVLTARQCFAGPFETLPPIVYDNWFMAVKEGMPIWTQSRDLQAMIVIPSILGLFGSLVGLSRAICPEHRMAWASLLAMQAVAFLVSLDVMRAMSYAHLLALPGNAVLLASLLGAVQRLRIMPLRVALSAATAVLTPFGASAAMAAALDPHAPPAQSETVADRFRCTTYAALRGLDALPASLLFTPLDVGAHMLVYTHHSVVATGHHRNTEGMKDAISGLIATPDDARAIVTSTGARYVAFCKGENEIVKYARRNPHSLIAGLLKGQHPDWLVPVQMRPGEAVKVYRIVYSAA